MSLVLRQSTASQEILLGPFVDSTDGNTSETGLTIANTDIKLFKHGGTTLTDKTSGGATHISNGYYYAVLDATDTDTVGNIEVNVKVAGALAVRREFIVVEEAVYDALFAASAPGPLTTLGTNAPANWINAAAIAADAITDAKVASDVTISSVTGSVGSIASGGITAASIATDAIDADAIAASGANKVADHIRRRTQANVEASSDGDALSLGSEYGLIQQAQESAVAATTLTVYRTDGTTSLGTKTLTGDPTADPIVAIQ